ncbi:unnamed protein product [Vitrella brassicaformis CCMP3155]|uniref:Prokaryotic-type class I peptide chain release factors domain-containing protein n=2 Tax=Vitrella brassicaformis TaxID=1169539 RepID=A0A0G4H7A8_VITBC|nr:unnamed protein product [Vitrella brassicaformis CCMP3155]|eukprot:CEM39530.1 unnamed protein product [Vitrella brassicaformis CCMP3155]
MLWLALSFIIYASFVVLNARAFRLLSPHRRRSIDATHNPPSSKGSNAAFISLIPSRPSFATSRFATSTMPIWPPSFTILSAVVYAADGDDEDEDDDNGSLTVLPLTLDLSDASQKSLEERMRQLGIDEADLIEKFIRGGGKGGQKINKTSNCVMLQHQPTGVVIRCQAERSRTRNRIAARQLLLEKLEARIKDQQRKEEYKRQKELRRARQPTEGQKRKTREQNIRRSEIKKWRAKSRNPSFD